MLSINSCLTEQDWQSHNFNLNRSPSGLNFDRFDPRPVETKDLKNIICCFSAKHAAFGSKGKDWPAWIHSDMSGYCYMTACGLFHGELQLHVVHNKSSSLCRSSTRQGSWSYHFIMFILVAISFYHVLVLSHQHVLVLIVPVLENKVHVKYDVFHA